MAYRSGDVYYKELTTRNLTTGASADADLLPVASANHNGVDDASFVLAVAHLDLGRYMISGVIPSGYSDNDVVNVTVETTVGGITNKTCVETFVLGSASITIGASITEIRTT